MASDNRMLPPYISWAALFTSPGPLGAAEVDGAAYARKPLDGISILSDENMPPEETHINFTLGIRYTDGITGFTGVATSLMMSLHSSDQVLLECGGDDGEPKREWFEVTRLVEPEGTDDDALDIYDDGWNAGYAAAARTDSDGVFWPTEKAEALCCGPVTHTYGPQTTFGGYSPHITIIDEMVQQTPLERLNEAVREAMREYGYDLVDESIEAMLGFPAPRVSTHPSLGDLAKHIW